MMQYNIEEKRLILLKNFSVYGVDLYEQFRKQVGLLTFTTSVSEWCEKTNAIGMYSKMGQQRMNVLQEFQRVYIDRIKEMHYNEK